VSEVNKAKVRRVYDEAFNKGNMAVIDELCAPGFVDHNPSPGQAQGIAALKASLSEMRAAISGFALTVDHIVAEGDLVAAHVTFRGKHTGNLFGLPPTGKDVIGRISDIVRLQDGKAVERWGVEDMSGVFAA
jgi:predicted ester cyclase